MSPDPRNASDVEEEQEVDFRRYWDAILGRLWLPLAGIAVGLGLGYLSTLGGHTVYRAEAVVYLGQPLSPNGATPLQSLATNPNTTREIVRSVSALRQAARISGLPLPKLRGHVSTKAVANTATKKSASGQTPLVRISVTGGAPLKVALAANALADRVVHSVSGYADMKISSFTEQLKADDEALAAIDSRAQALHDALRAAGNASALEKLVLISQEDITEQRRAALIEQRTSTQQLLVVAQLVERSRVVSRASAVNTTARSVRSSLFVGALIGLLLGLIAALAWDPVSARFARRSSV
jgi:hypothetical protein